MLCRELQQQCWRVLACVAWKWKHATIWIPPYELPPLPPQGPLPLLVSSTLSSANFIFAHTLCSTFVSPRAPALELSRCIVTRECLKKGIFWTRRVAFACPDLPAIWPPHASARIVLAVQCSDRVQNVMQHLVQNVVQCRDLQSQCIISSLKCNALLCNAVAFTLQRKVGYCLHYYTLFACSCILSDYPHSLKGLLSQ